MFRQWLGNWKRRLVQLVSLGIIGEWSFYGIFRCPFAVPYIGCGNCPVIQCPGRSLWMWGWILIGLSAVLFGRVFCGWVCPGGLVSEILSMGAFFKNKINRIASSFLASESTSSWPFPCIFFRGQQSPLGHPYPDR